jgi:hypothetical protein
MDEESRMARRHGQRQKARTSLVGQQVVTTVAVGSGHQAHEDVAKDERTEGARADLSTGNGWQNDRHA